VTFCGSWSSKSTKKILPEITLFDYCNQDKINPKENERCRKNGSEVIKDLGIIGGEKKDVEAKHPMLGKRCIIRTFSAGVHIGDVVYINPNNSMEVKLENALRLWKWTGGGLRSQYAANRYGQSNLSG
jgi:hypothetical protein